MVSGDPRMCLGTTDVIELLDNHEPRSSAPVLGGHCQLPTGGYNCSHVEPTRPLGFQDSRHLR